MCRLERGKTRDNDMQNMSSGFLERKNWFKSSPNKNNSNFTGRGIQKQNMWF